MSQEKSKQYIAIDLKSFFASVECVERNLDPLGTNLVVADLSRTEKTICLAVSPSLKKLGIPGRARLFEVVQKVKEANALRKHQNHVRSFQGSSSDAQELATQPSLAIDYIVAPPRMAQYIKYSTKIYSIYLKYIAQEDIHVYSIDEVIMEVTNYLGSYGLTASQLAGKIIKDIYHTTGITGTAGIGTNMYLAKIAMDILAKHAEPDQYGIRIGALTELSYRQKLWDHQPITDFWRVGKGYAKKLAQHRLYTMGDIARCSLGGPREYFNEDLLYRLFGVNAQLLIDHAWGWEPCTIAEIRQYLPKNRSLCSGQVLQAPHIASEARIIAWEMADALSLDLFAKGLTTDQLVLHIGYDIESLNPQRATNYKGPIVIDNFGKQLPKPAHGTINLEGFTSSSQQLTQAIRKLFDQIVNPQLLIRRLTITANHVTPEDKIPVKAPAAQLDLFADLEGDEQQLQQQQIQLAKEKSIQQAILNIKQRFGKNALLKGTNLQEGATAISRNQQIGGHKA